VSDSTDLRERVARRTAATSARRSAANASPTVPTPQDAPPIDIQDEPSPDLSARRGSASKSMTLPVRGRQMAAVGPDVDLTKEISAADLVMPKIRLSQAMSEVFREHMRTKGASGVAGGHWYHSTSKTDLGETLYFIPCDMRKSRALFVQGQGLMCRSFDLLQGEGDPGILCEGTYEERHEYPADERGCELRLWTKNEDGSNAPPKCGLTYNYTGIIVLDPEDPEKTKTLSGLLQLRSASTSVAKQMNTIVMEQGEGIWRNVLLALGVEEKTNRRGTFWVPTVDLFDLTTVDEWGRVRRVADGLAKSMSPDKLRATLEAEGED
jgi:hypothetical protein